MTAKAIVPRGCVVCGAEQPDPHDVPTHEAHEERLRRDVERAAREELARADQPLAETELAGLWGDR